MNNSALVGTDWWNQQKAEIESDEDQAAQDSAQNYFKYLEKQQERQDYIDRTRISDQRLSARGRLAQLGRFGVRGRTRRDAQAQMQALDLLQQLEDRRQEDRKHGVETAPEFVQNIQDQVNKLLKPRSIWDDLREDANKKFGNIVESFSDAVGQMAAKGGSLKNWWRNLWGDMVSWFTSFVVRTVMNGVAQMVTGGQQPSLFGGGSGGGGFLGALGSLFGGGGRGGGNKGQMGGGSPLAEVGGPLGALTAPWETGGTPPFAPTGGIGGGISAIGGVPVIGKLLAKLGLGGIGGTLASLAPWLAGAALLWNPLKKLGSGIWRGVKKVGGGIWRGVKKLFHFDDPINDANAMISGRDFTELFTKGVAMGMARLTAHTMMQNGGMMALMSGSAPGRQMLARMGGYREERSVSVPSRNEYHFHQPTFMNRQMMDTFSDNVDRNLAEKIRLRSGRGSFAGRDRR